MNKKPVKNPTKQKVFTQRQIVAKLNKYALSLDDEIEIEQYCSTQSLFINNFLSELKSLFK